ncbi:NlpC/P60 family protein [Kitasatospora sp. GP82]|uniref:NlpC/P60 family protein n=1 Tax=Kitasatospora sp. GP82 TaxID=3035089 RepID=UPI002472FE79|nr:NlpC/P60 family protein [Kitasatospora sp. GP82]MDH6127258.1 cell wall-associated NlpC family hydrolase [Kitasatospora sp. GP82]
MASHRRPKQPSRARVSVLTAAAATAVALSANASAHAAPAQPSTDEVKVQIDQLNQDQEKAAEQFNGAQEKADQLRKQADQLQDQVARGQDQLTQLQNSLSAVAGDQYRSGGIDPTVALMLSANPDGYLDQASSADQVNRTEADILKALKEQQLRLDQQKQEAASVLAELDRNTQTLNDAKAQVQQKLQEAKTLLGSLTAQQRAAVEAADRASRGDSRFDLKNLPNAGGYAQAAVGFAMGKRGSDYVWGAEGSSTFDCSGLMMWAYGQAGVSLPRTSQEQAGVGSEVPSLAQAQPGDLVIYFSDAHHVGMYIGNGLVVHAPHTGDVVKVMQADALPIDTIRRV